MPYLSCGGSISSEPTTGIYGVEWSGTSQTSWLRTDDSALFADPNPYYSGMSGTPSSPFDDIMPWAGMERVEDTNAGTLVKIPKFWYKWTRENATMKLQIANYAADGFLVSPAHADRGDGSGERDEVYVGAYHCGASTYKSTTGILPEGNHTRADFRTSIHNLGSDIWQWDYALLWTIQMLYLVEYADWNSQGEIGRGGSPSGSATNSGACDSMVYHTGTNSADRNTPGNTRYRYIEDLWGNGFAWCDGIYVKNSTAYCIKNPSQFSDTSGGTEISPVVSRGYIKSYTIPSVSGFEYAIIPATVDSGLDGSTYVGDFAGVLTNGCWCVGGDYGNNFYNGLFRLLSYGESTESSNIGSRLMKL